MSDGRRKARNHRDEYIDHQGRVRHHSAAYYRRRKEVRIKLAIMGVLALIVLVGTGLLIWNFLIPHGSGEAEALEAAEGSGEYPLQEEEMVSLDDTRLSAGEGDEDFDASLMDTGSESDEALSVSSDDTANSDMGFFKGYSPYTTEKTAYISDPEVNSTYAILIDLTDGSIVGQKNPDTVISPASMTKIMTVLVAAEHIKKEDLSNTFSMNRAITDKVYQNEGSAVGFAVDEQIPVKDLFFGTILPSGGDAALALAEYVAGSEEAFVDLMNEKAKELGISGTARFANPIGLYDENNHCTVKDMAMILKAAVENDISREALSAHTYTTSVTEQHPEGITISNWFLRRIEDKDTHGTVVAAKTGFVIQSGNCAASYAVSNDGRPYICVTGNAHSAWRCIYDHVAIYQDYLKSSGTDSTGAAVSGN